MTGTLGSQSADTYWAPTKSLAPRRWDVVEKRQTDPCPQEA